MGCSRRRRGEGRVDGAGDVLSTVKGGPGYVGGVKTGGGSGGRILRRTEVVRGFLASRLSLAFPFLFSVMVPAIGFYWIFWPAVSDSLDRFEWSRWVAISSLPPIRGPSFNSLLEMLSVSHIGRQAAIVCQI
jgi:hypothetical protein